MVQLILNLDNKKADISIILVSLILAITVGLIFGYRYLKTTNILFEKADDIGTVKESCQNYCYSLQKDSYCHLRFNLKYEVNDKSILLEDITCNFLSNLYENSPLKILKCDSIQCNDLILENNQNQYQRQNACNSYANIKIVYSLNDKSSDSYSILESTNCFNDLVTESSTNPDFEGISVSLNSLEDNARKEVLNTMGKYVGYNSFGENCWEAVSFIYKNANVVSSCIYSDPAGKSYPLITSKKTSTVIGKNTPFLINSEQCLYQDFNEQKKLNLLETGDIISYIWNKDTGHNAIFIEWTNKDDKIAKLFDWNGKDHKYRYYEEEISDKKHPVYVIWKPIKKLQEVSS